MVNEFEFRGNYSTKYPNFMKMVVAISLLAFLASVFLVFGLGVEGSLNIICGLVMFFSPFLIVIFGLAYLLAKAVKYVDYKVDEEKITSVYVSGNDLLDKFLKFMASWMGSGIYESTVSKVEFKNVRKAYPEVVRGKRVLVLQFRLNWRSELYNKYYIFFPDKDAEKYEKKILALVEKNTSKK